MLWCLVSAEPWAHSPLEDSITLSTYLRQMQRSLVKRSQSQCPTHSLMLYFLWPPFLGLLLYSEWLYSVWARRLEEWPGSAGVMLTGWRAGSLEIAPFGAGSWDSFELSLSWNHTVVWFGRDQFLHSEKGQLQLGQSAQSPVQPDLGCLQGWGIQYPSWRPVLFTIKKLFSYIHLSILSVHQKISNTHIFLL